MTVSSQQHAYLADHSYGRDERGNAVDFNSLVDKQAVIGGERYKILAFSDQPSGYQGVVYQHVNSGAIIVAHRGTEFERQMLEDLVVTDGSMVVARHNPQAKDAIDLTRTAISMADEYARDNGVSSPAVTVTGHSLGGTLAQISGHYFGLKGETFNAYGAASLNLRNPVTGKLYRVPEEGNDFVNHVMGADMVSAASPHYGQVRVYSNAQEIDTLKRNGYENNRSRIFDRRNDVGAAIDTMRGGSHDMHNFLPWDGDYKPDRPVLSDAQARAVAAQYDPMLDKYRDDVSNLRGLTTTLSRSGLGHLQDAVLHFRSPLPPGEPARQAEQHLRRRGAFLDPEMQGSPDMRDPGHPAFGRYQQVYAGVSTIDRNMGRSPDEQSERLAASLTAASPHIPEVANVTLSRDGSRAFVLGADNGPNVRGVAYVETAAAIKTPVEESTRQWQANAEAVALNNQTAQQQQAREQQEQLQRRGPVLA
ncbi:XVIPCD domain-containing protein [Luteimonas sp. e5]